MNRKRYNEMNENMNMNQGIDNSYNNNSMMDASLVNPDMMNMNYSDVMNNNNSNSELDEMLKKKIEKREKFDTILAYVLIVILVGCIITVLVLKFTKKDEPVIDENTPKYIGLSEIVDTLNTSNLASSYRNDGATFSSNLSGNSMVVTYTKEDINLNLNIPLLTNELEVVIPSENDDIATAIYREIATIVCVYYGNTERSCQSTLIDINVDDQVDGIRYVSDGNINSVYIDITKSIEVKEFYSEVTKTSIDNTNYSLDLLDVVVDNINIEKSSTNIKFSGDIETMDDSLFSVVVRLYDSSDNLIKESKVDYTGNNVFEVDFVLDDELKLENIINYSIDIEKQGE